jgi:hypothetical protein
MPGEFDALIFTWNVPATRSEGRLADASGTVPASGFSGLGLFYITLAKDSTP